jgi:hypothetical protein
LLKSPVIAMFVKSSDPLSNLFDLSAFFTVYSWFYSLILLLWPFLNLLLWWSPPYATLKCWSILGHVLSLP